MFLGSELVSTIAKTGIPRRLASFTAMFSFITSTTKRALGRRVRSAIEPRFFSSFAAIAEGVEERKVEKADEKAAAEQNEGADKKRVRKARKEEAPKAEATETPAAE